MLATSHKNSFVHLHLHTQYSLLDGAIRVGDLIEKAVEFNMPAVAQTDHGNMFGAIDFFSRARKAGIRPILGSEIYFSPGSRFDRKTARRNKKVDSQDEMESRHHIHHLILLCKNKKGYENLCKLLSKAYMEGFYYKPRADLDLLTQCKEGLIATTACLKGEVGYNFFSDQDERAHLAAEKLLGIFKDDFYLEIQENGLPEQKLANEKIMAFAQKRGIPLVATNDCHYLEPEDAKAQEVLLCIQTGKTFADQGRMKLSTNEFYFKSAEKMREAFSYYPEACDNTLRIADKCNLNLSWKDESGNQIYHLPEFNIQTGETIEKYFRREIKSGLKKRFTSSHFTDLVAGDDWEMTVRPRYEKRLEREATFIEKTGLIGYFLIVSDFIKWAKARNIPVGPGRGSGAGSLVAYALTITNIDPLPYNLLFERFINPERVSLPDFDVDFCQYRRKEVIDYVTEKYGNEKVAQIITFGSMQAKAAIRDVGRVYGLSFTETDALVQLIPDVLGISLEKAISMEPKLKQAMDRDPKIHQIINVARRLEGLPRHASIHAAGIIITNRPLIEYCPLFRGKEGERVVQFDKDFSEKIGLVKFDFLGLKTLTVIDEAGKFIRRDHDDKFNIEHIDMKDEKVFQYLSEGKTTGVFQLESDGMINLCRRLLPDSMEDLTAINALYRPGPLESGMVDDFIDIKHGRKKMTFLFDELKPILKDTYGVIVYQEQVMHIARTIAGYGLGSADMLRRAMGKKKKEEMERHRKIFLEGAEKQKFDVEKAEELYDLMANFAAYGFNKSHAVAYAYIAYQTAWLKYHHPSPFFAALLSSELNNTDKVIAYIEDAKKHGIKVLPPDINESLLSFNVVDGDIRFGMGAVKNVGESAVNLLIKERETGGSFKGLVDFCERMKQINKRMLESLILVGAFDNCEKMNRKTMHEHRELIMLNGQKRMQEREMGQLNLFDQETQGNETMLDVDHLEDFDEKEKLSYESQLMGIYVSGHPLNKYKGLLSQMTSMKMADILHVKGKDKRPMILGGLISSVKTLFTKKGDKMAFVGLQDLSGKIDCVVFPKIYSRYEHFWDTDEPVIMTGMVSLGETPRKFFPEQVQKLEESIEQKIDSVDIRVEMETMSSHLLEQLKQTVLKYRGDVPVHFIFENTKGEASMPLGEEYLVHPSPQFASRINNILQKNSVEFMIKKKSHSQMMERR